MIETIVLAELLANADVAALVSTRAYTGSLPQGGTLPAIRLQLVSSVDSVVLANVGRTNYFRARLQLDAFVAKDYQGDGYGVARSTGSAIAACLVGRSFTGGGSPDALLVESVTPIDRGITYEEDELKVWRDRQDVYVTYREL